MSNPTGITTLFIDIGGVLLSNGWDHLARQRAATWFKLNWTEMENKHKQSVEDLEEGKITLDEYLNRVVFLEKRPFTREQFQDFIFEQSSAYPDMIKLILELKATYGLKVVVVSNEGRELNAYRISKFKLDRFVDMFISSCFVHLRKPDVDIFHVALDIAQVSPAKVVFIENTEEFVKVAQSLGIRSILHKDVKSTTDQLVDLGLQQEVLHAS